MAICHRIAAVLLAATTTFNAGLMAQSLPADVFRTGQKDISQFIVGSYEPGTLVHATRGGASPNALCSGAVITPLTIGTPATVTGNNSGSATDPILSVNVVWEAFTITTCADISVGYCGTAPAFAGSLITMAVGCPIDYLVFNTLANVQDMACGDGNLTILFPDLPAGTYYFPVLDSPGSSGDYSLVFTASACSGTPPVNANCSGALPLVSALDCVPVAGTVEFATAAGNTGTGCGVGGDISDGVWYSFVATSGSHEVVVQPSDQFSGHLQIFDGACGALATIGCGIGDNFGLETSSTQQGLAVGDTYYVRVADFWAGNPVTPTFTICVLGLPTVVCDADAGGLTADASSVCFANGTASISATADGTAEVPTGFETVYVLTSGAALIIQATSPTPSFDVTAVGNYTIHTLVYDTTTLDLGTVVLGQTTGGQVNALLVQGGGTICASLDVAGAPVVVQVCLPCAADAGALTINVAVVCLDADTVTVSATVDGSAVVPAGFSTLYLLTSGIDLVIQQASVVPSFEVTSAGTYTLHTLVFDGATLDLGQLTFGVSTGGVVNALLIQGGGTICASLDVAGAPVVVQVCLPCAADAGALTINVAVVCLDADTVTVSATVDGSAVVPPDFSTLYLLTSGIDLVIQQASVVPSFEVTSAGTYTIHTLVYDGTTLDLGQLSFGVSTGGEVNALLIQGGGTICASLDVAGAPVTVEVCCPADAGTLTADDATVCFDAATVTLSATPDGNAEVPAGFQTVYVLTSGANLVIEAAGATPSFDVTAVGTYTIHTLVYDTATLDLGIIVFGETTGGDVNGLLVQGGGTICASLDVPGAPIAVVVCCPAIAGTLVAAADTLCFLAPSVTISATPDGNVVVPAGFQTVYVLTSGTGLVIEEAGALPEFVVDAPGLYTIHTLVYDPLTLDLGTIVFGQTTGGAVNGLLIQGGGTICASLDVAGAPVVVELCCEAEAGTLTASASTVCLLNDSAAVSATPGGNSVVPAGFSTLYVLTSGADLVIQQVSVAPSFDVTTADDYTIHTLVYDPTTLDLGTFTFGETTGGEVNALLIQGGGIICASLDVAGAPISVEDCTPVNDDCADAISLPINAIGDCPEAAVIGNNTYASQDGGDPGCDATQESFLDVWYTFNSGANTLVTIDLDPGTMTQWAITVSDACSGGNEVYCEVSPGGPIDLTTTVDTDYWVRIYSNTEIGQGGEFTLCFSGAAPTFVCDGGEVSAVGGDTEITVCQNSAPDVIDLATTSTSVEDYAYIATDANNIVVTLLAGNSLDFNALPLGVYRVWGVSYNGDLQGATPGQLATEITSTGDCLELSANFVLVSVEICVGVDGLSASEWTLFPNPGNGEFNLRYAGTSGRTLLEVIDMQGRLVYQQSVPMTHGQVHTVNVAGKLAAGSYTVRLSNGNEVNNLRLSIR